MVMCLQVFKKNVIWRDLISMVESLIIKKGGQITWGDRTPLSTTLYVVENRPKIEYK